MKFSLFFSIPKKNEDAGILDSRFERDFVLRIDAGSQSYATRDAKGKRAPKIEDQKTDSSFFFGIDLRIKRIIHDNK